MNKPKFYAEAKEWIEYVWFLEKQITALKSGAQPAQTNNRPIAPCCKTDTVAVVLYYKCLTCGRIVEPERD